MKLNSVVTKSCYFRGRRRHQNRWLAFYLAWKGIILVLLKSFIVILAYADELLLIGLNNHLDNMINFLFYVSIFRLLVIPRLFQQETIKAKTVPLLMLIWVLALIQYQLRRILFFFWTTSLTVSFSTASFSTFLYYAWLLRILYLFFWK